MARSRKVNRILLIVVAVFLLMPGVLWLLGSEGPRHHRVYRRAWPTVEEHESLPMPPGHLDRG